MASFINSLLDRLFRRGRSEPDADADHEAEMLDEEDEEDEEDEAPQR